MTPRQQRIIDWLKLVDEANKIPNRDFFGLERIVVRNDYTRPIRIEHWIQNKNPNKNRGCTRD